VASALDVVTRLRLKRFGMSIDDFGTGHSSLAKLRDIPFDELKIDQSFVHEAGSEPRLRAIYGASLALGQQLNMQVVAEGVESRADWDYVRASGCNLAQGFFIARPMPAEAVGPWRLDWQGRLAAESLLAG
jgi:EAL domain-containing protein (putative c-di-GMP-specific phosphodiesterase class I)